MRLLHTQRLQVQDFVPGKAPEKYAILSHTWEDEEVTLEDMEKGIAKSKTGYRKLQRSCDLAEKDKYEWIWIDTCCIDKRNSAELSEAINSMFQYYNHSAICYVYLSNIDSLDSLKEAKWFERGWTLQELLAPRNVTFLDRNWKELGTKRTLFQQISSRTRIPEDVILGKSVHSCNIGQRMSWASERKTTREEDIAYCLLGLFDIHMVPIYGEGAEQAFLRLQVEILQRSADHTLFIWTPEHDPNNQGLLASSPRPFCSHPECFAWMQLRHFPKQSFFDGYAYMKRLSNKTSKRTFKVDTDTGEARLISESHSLEPVAASLGQSGLQLSLLSHIPDNSETSSNLGGVHKMLFFDLVVICNGSRDPVHLVLVRDMDIANFNGTAPDRLGKWRRGTWYRNQATYTIESLGMSFSRAPITISQVKTAVPHPEPVTFSFDGSQSETLISRLLLVESTGGRTIYSRLPKTFKCHGGIVVLQHSCSHCDHKSKTVLCFGGHGRVVYQPWCSVGTIDVSREDFLDEVLYYGYESNERLSSRYGSSSRKYLSCKTRVSGQIDFGIDEDHYIIKLRSVRDLDHSGR